MNRLWKAAGIALSASCFVVFQASAKADILVFQFDQVCTGDTPGGTPPWAFLTISDAAPDIVGITLTHSPTSAEGQFLTELDLSLTSIPGDVMAMEPYDPLVTDVEIGENFFTDAGYQFDVRISYVNAPPPDCFLPGMSATTYIMGTGLTAASFMTTTEGDNGVWGMLHLQGIAGGGSSKLCDDPVPEPSTLCAVAFCLAALLRRRKK
jgi:hypothetical protein